MARIPAGDYWIGSASGAEDEQPRHAVRLEAFWIDVHEVTSVEFAAFVAATGYLTVAQRAGHAWVFDRERKAWRLGKNASWRLPDGREPAAPNEPVTQVCWSDAVAFARWAGKRLPSEAEWEAAAAGGLFDAAYPWGRELRPQGRYEANYWQGWFPDEDLGKDGFRGVAPIRSFRPNRYGLYDMAGNVAEWCADWHSEDYYQSGQMANPVGPAEGDAKVLRGGSWISAENAFRSLLCIYARQHLPPTVAREDVGFRCARDAETKPILK
jgi:formylglycine-generating enzyme required for sulfatase activity